MLILQFAKVALWLFGVLLAGALVRAQSPLHVGQFVQQEHVRHASGKSLFDEGVARVESRSTGM